MTKPSTPRTIISVVICTLLAALMFQGCTLGQQQNDPDEIMPPWDQAQVYGMKAKKIVEAAHVRALRVEATGTLEEKTFFWSSVNDVINKAKHVVADYLDVTAEWEHLAITGVDSDKPVDLIELELKVGNLLLDLADLIGPYIED